MALAKRRVVTQRAVTETPLMQDAASGSPVRFALIGDRRNRAELAAALGEHGLDIASLLTERQIDVLACLAEGYAYRTIASTLLINVGTVQSHVKNIYRRLRVSSREQVAMLAGRRPRA